MSSLSEKLGYESTNVSAVSTNIFINIALLITLELAYWNPSKLSTPLTASQNIWIAIFWGMIILDMVLFFFVKKRFVSFGIIAILILELLIVLPFNIILPTNDFWILLLFLVIADFSNSMIAYFQSIKSITRNKAYQDRSRRSRSKNK